MCGARHARAQPVWAHKPRAAERVHETTRTNWACSCRSIIEIEDLLVERVGGRRCAKDRVNVNYGRGFKLGAWDSHEQRLGNEQPQAFCIEEEEQFLFFDGTAQRTRPLIGDVEWPRNAKRVVEPIVRIEHSAVPIVLRVAVKLIPPRTSDVIYVCPSRAPELTGIADADHCCFLNLVLAQKQIARTSIVRTYAVLVFVHSVYREKN